MVKPNTFVYFVTQLHTCPHAEPDKTTFHTILHIIVHLQMVSGNYCKKLFCKFYPENVPSIHAYQSTERTKNHRKDFIPVRKCTYKMYTLSSWYQYFVVQTNLGYVEVKMQIQQYFSKSKSYVRKRDRQTDRQTDRPTDRQTERPTGRQAGRQRQEERYGARRELNLPPCFFNCT